MKKLLIFIMLFCSISAYSTVYYISATGSDSNDGLSIGTPKQTLTAVNALSLSGDDQVLFKKGDGWYGSLTPKSGTSGHPVIYGTYGTGGTPTITEFTTVSAWTDLGSNIWESTSAVSSLSTLSVVTINGTNTAMGREPESGIYFVVDSHNANISLTSSSLSGIDWTGAQVVIRKERWDWNRANVTSHTGTTIAYTDEQAYPSESVDGWGFFIQNDVRTLDVQNEWYYNPTSKKIRIYSVGIPSNVKVSTVEQNIFCSSKNYITIQDIKFEGAETYSVYCVNSTGILFQNCEFSSSGYYGVFAQNVDNSDITSCTFGNIYTSAIYANGTCNDLNILSNSITDNGMLIGMMHLYPISIFTYATNSLIQYNNVINSGYNGIKPKSGSIIVRNNFVLNSCLTLDDGGGIYTDGDQTGLIIDGNVVINTVGYKLGTSDVWAQTMSCGIYLDVYSQGITISNNTVFGSGWAGIFISRGSYNTITGNLVYDNKLASIWLSDYTGLNVAHDNIMTGNIFVAKADQSTMQLHSSINNTSNFFSTSNNNYFSRPAGTSESITISQPNDYSYKTLAQWKLFAVGKDVNSHETPQTVSAEADIQFEYNATANPVTRLLNYPSIDIYGNKYTGVTVTIPAYSSYVFLKDANSTTKNIYRIGGNLMKTGSTIYRTQ